MIKGINKLDLSEAAVEIDGYLNGKDFGFESLEKVKSFLEKETMDFEEEMFLWNSFKKNSQKEYKYIPDIQLEKKLMLYEIRDIRSISRERAEELMNVFCNMTSYLIKKEFESNRKYIAA